MPMHAFEAPCPPQPPSTQPRSADTCLHVILGIAEVRRRPPPPAPRRPKSVDDMTRMARVADSCIPLGRWWVCSLCGCGSMVGHKFIEALKERDSENKYNVVTFCEEKRAAYNRMRLTEVRGVPCSDQPSYGLTSPDETPAACVL